MRVEPISARTEKRLPPPEKNRIRGRGTAWFVLTTMKKQKGDQGPSYLKEHRKKEVEETAVRIG